MAEFRKILISGSNAAVKEVKAVLNNNSSLTHRVVVYDTSTGIFYYTGSYQNAGGDVDFPGYYDGNMDLTTSAGGSSQDRFIRIGQNRSTDGSGSIEFITNNNSISTGLTITRHAGLNANTEISHSGTGDFIVKLLNEGSTQNSFQITNQNNQVVYKIQKNGQVFCPFLPTGNATFGLRVDGNTGEFFVYASSKKFKKNIKDLDPKIIENFDKLRPVSFNYIRDKDDTLPFGGFIAEETAEVHPLLAEYGANYNVNPEGEYDTESPLINDQQVPININETAILAATVAKIQELDKKIKELKKLKS